jgi:hypothetical protein|tara:strand:+ start:464 stop:844 length:381 start_codon:yes stop_codon:yes gene_type:complete
MVEVERDSSGVIVSVDGYAVPEGCKSKDLKFFEHLGQKLDMPDGRKIYVCRRNGCPCCDKIFWEHRHHKTGKFNWLKIKPYKKEDGKVYWKDRLSGNERTLAPKQLKMVKAVWEKHNKPMVLEVRS